MTLTQYIMPTLILLRTDQTFLSYSIVIVSLSRGHLEKKDLKLCRTYFCCVSITKEVESSDCECI